MSKQDMGIPMGIEPAPFWENLFAYFFFRLSIFKIWFQKNQPELQNIMLNDDDEFSKFF